MLPGLIVIFAFPTGILIAIVLVVVAEIGENRARKARSLAESTQPVEQA